MNEKHDYDETFEVDIHLELEVDIKMYLDSGGQRWSKEQFVEQFLETLKDSLDSVSSHEGFGVGKMGWLDFSDSYRYGGVFNASIGRLRKKTEYLSPSGVNKTAVEYVCTQDDREGDIAGLVRQFEWLLANGEKE